MVNNSSKKPDQANNLMGYWVENQNESFDDLWGEVQAGYFIEAGELGKLCAGLG